MIGLAKMRSAYKGVFILGLPRFGRPTGCALRNPQGSDWFDGEFSSAAEPYTVQMPSRNVGLMIMIVKNDYGTLAPEKGRSDKK